MFRQFGQQRKRVFYYLWFMKRKIIAFSLLLFASGFALRAQTNTPNNSNKSGTQPVIKGTAVESKSDKEKEKEKAAADKRAKQKAGLAASEAEDQAAMKADADKAKAKQAEKNKERSEKEKEKEKKEKEKKHEKAVEGQKNGDARRIIPAPLGK